MKTPLALAACIALAACSGGDDRTTDDGLAATAEPVTNSGPTARSDRSIAGGEWTDYRSAALARAQAEGRTVIVHVTGNDCTSCTAQRAAIDAMAGDPALSDAVLMAVDYDDNAPFAQAHDVTGPGTVLRFDGRDLAARIGPGEDDAALRRVLSGTA